MIGDTLRAEREKQNLTIKDIEKGTSIRSLYIDCIEKGEYQQLPGEVYTKGFIRNYANFLKLDADAAVKQYMDENHPAAAVAAEPEENSTMREEPPKKKAAAFSTGNDFRQRVETSHKRQNKLLLVLIALIVAGGAVYLLHRKAEAAFPIRSRRRLRRSHQGPLRRRRQNLCRKRKMMVSK